MHWRSWLTLGYYDVVATYRRTIIGPLWQPLQATAWILGLWAVFGRERGGNPLPYIGCGVVFWQYISMHITSSPNIFFASRNLILSIKKPLSFFVLRAYSALSIRWSTQLVVILGLIFFFDLPIGWNLLSALIGLLLLFYNALWVALFLAMLGVRFPDLQFALEALMRVLFFMTPIFWSPGDDVLRTLIATYNPFSHFLEIVRSPILGDLPTWTNYGVVVAFSIFGPIVTLALYTRIRNSVVFWL